MFLNLKCKIFSICYKPRFQLIYSDLKYLNIFSKCWLFFKINNILKNIENKKHQLAIEGSSSLICKGYPIGYYYHAKVEFLRGNDEKAKEFIETFLSFVPQHDNAIFLYSEILEFLKDHKKSREVLIQQIGNTTRRKLWQYLARIVRNESEFIEYERLLMDTFGQNLESLSYDLLCHYTDAAYKAGRQDQALQYWKNKYAISVQDNIENFPSKVSGYTDVAASDALLDLKMVFGKENIEFFLISGTLLGCIREGKLLGHDKDIDIGIWDHQNIDVLISVLRKSGYFYILSNQNNELIVIKHLNGITIDVFVHYRKDNDYYHVGIKCAWHNTPFTLIEYSFLGDKYLIPEDYNLYLIENYGEDWKVPKISFDSALDTPNISVIDTTMMQIYFYKKLLSSRTMYQNALNDRFVSALHDLSKKD